MQPHETPAATKCESSWAAPVIALLVVLASFLGGATQRWSEAIVIGCFALLLLVQPPRFSLGKIFNALVVLLLLLAALAFLPARWFGIPDWRRALTNDLGIILPPTLTPQPWLTLYGVFMLVAGLAWVYYLCTCDAQLRDIRQAARAFAAGMTALAALSIALHLTRHPLFFWHNAAGFGPYPNRNQTGDLFGISTLVLLGCMQDDFRRGHKRWLFWLVGVGVLIAALIINFSRAGILILVIGAIAWLARFALRKASAAGVAVAVSVLLLLFTALLLFGGQTIERFHLRLGSEGSMTSEYRWLIFRDAWTLIKASPWCGIGLGNFDGIFALFRDFSRSESRSLHPESDWVWLWTEMGWPSLLIIFAGAALLVRRVPPLRDGTNQRIRYTALIAAILFALHGFVDVAGHRFGTFLAGTFLLGIAQYRPPREPVRAWMPVLFRIIALFLLGVSLVWLIAWKRDWPVPGEIAVQEATQAATIAEREHRFQEAIELTDRGLQSAPLDWHLYFLRATARIGAHEPFANAVADFRRARFLEPSGYQVPLREGQAWLGVQPTLALTAWREALRRRGPPNDGLYSYMFSLVGSSNPPMRQMLGELAGDDPSLTITWLQNISGAPFTAAIQGVLARDPTLATFSPAQKTKLFTIWSEREATDELLATVAAHPEWMPFAWPAVARVHADRHEFAAAWQLVRRFGQEPALPQVDSNGTIPALEQKLYANPDDFLNGYALYRAQTAAGKIDDALATLRHFTALPNVPPYFHYLEAQTWAAKGNFERAWQAWETWRDARGPSE